MTLPLGGATTMMAAAGSGFAPNVSDATSVFNPASPSAEAIRSLFFLVLAISAVIFVLVVGMLLYFVLRYRQRGETDDTEPPQIYGSNRLEWAWTIGPTLIVFVLFLVVIRTVVAMRGATGPPEGIEVRVVAHQWWWEFQYPEDGFTTANEMHIPVTTPDRHRPVHLDLVSADVVHSFWVPRLAGKTDVIPGRVNHMFFEALKPGLYRGQCSEYCGMQHAGMLIRVVAQQPDAFQAWVQQQRKPAVDDPAVAEGRRLFLDHTCRNCHRIRGTDADGDVGPDLTHLMSRQTLAALAIPNDRRHLLAWVSDPQAIKPGCKMPNLHLNPKTVEAMVDYLSTLD